MVITHLSTPKCPGYLKNNAYPPHLLEPLHVYSGPELVPVGTLKSNWEAWPY